MITAWIGSIAFFSVMILYVLLAMGLPLGEFAMGGRHKVMPKQMRIACGISTVVQLFAILVLLQVGNIFSIGLPENVAKGIAYFFGVYLCINIFLNAISASKKERFVITPLSVVTAFCFFYTAINS